MDLVECEGSLWERELYIQNVVTRDPSEPTLPLGKGGLAQAHLRTLGFAKKMGLNKAVLKRGSAIDAGMSW